MYKIILLFLCVEVFFLREVVDGCFATTKHHVYILNNLVSNSTSLNIHCASKDDDLGFHTISANQKYEWSFCKNFFSTTLFYCHLWWDSEDKAFDVFHEKFFAWSTHDSWWVAKNDGIYFSDYPQPFPLTKIYDWSN